MFRPSCRGDDSTKPSSLDVLGQPLQQPEPQLGAGLLTTAEHDGDLDLVTGTQEPDDVTLLGLVVVRVDLRPQLHLFDDRVGLVPAGLARLLRGLVLVLAEIHQLADRRTGRGRNLDQVEISFLCQPKCVLDPDDAYLLTVRSDQSHLGNADALVDAQFNGDGSSWVVLVLVPPRDHRRPLENTKALRAITRRPNSQIDDVPTPPGGTPYDRCRFSGYPPEPLSVTGTRRLCIDWVGGGPPLRLEPSEALEYSAQGSPTDRVGRRVRVTA